MERRIAAILAADMVGYSRLMELDESGIVSRQKRHRQELIDPKIAAHQGKIIKLTGDGLIAEFSSVVEAVQCAVTVQKEMERREQDTPEDRKIRYRAAVNLGDVIFDEGDVYGDGVNIAARLEALAEPGGVVVSGTAFDHLKANVAVGYEDLGEKRVKNIAAPVRVYRVVPDGSPTAPPARRLSRRAALSVAAGLCLAAIVVWEFGLRPDTVDAVAIDEAEILAMPTGPTIGVMPFEDVSLDEGGTLLAKGITEEIATGLGQHRSLGVLSTASTRSIAKENLVQLDAAKKLTADFLLEGAVQRLPNNLKVNAKLWSRRENTYVWTSSFEKDASTDDLYDVIAEISESVVGQVGAPYTGSVAREIRRRTKLKAPDALKDFECLASYDVNQWQNEEKERRYYECLKAVLERNPDHAPALAAWSEMHTKIYGVHALGEYVGNDYSFYTGTPKKLIETAFDAANKAIENDSFLAEGYWALAFAHSRVQNKPEFWQAASRALALGLNNLSSGWAGWRLAFSGKWELGTSLIERSARIDPVAAPSAWFLAVAGKSFWEDDLATAIRIAEEHRRPDEWFIDSMLVELYAANGDEESAQKSLDKVLKFFPGYSIKWKVDWLRNHMVEEAFIDKFVAVAQAAGVPSGGFKDSTGTKDTN